MWFKNLFRKKYSTGCIPDLPDDRDFIIESVLEADIELPDNYIVPKYREWFDDNFNVIPSKVQIKNQNGFGSCVSQATSRQKEGQEGVELSARFLHVYCKENDGIPSSEGTYLRTAQQGIIDVGDCEEILHLERHDISFSDYIKKDLVTAEAFQNATEHKSKSYLSVNGFDKIRQTMYQHETAVVEACTWYDNDNNMSSSNYRMQDASGKNVGGHAFCIIGWKKVGTEYYLIIANSWGNGWGDSGLFYTSEHIANTRLFNGWITIDMGKDLAKILQEYGNKVVKTIDGLEIHLISGGKKRLFSDEFIFWSNGYDFKDVVIINDEDLDLIPNGLPMLFVYDATYTTEQLKRITALFVENRDKALEFFSKYFK